MLVTCSNVLRIHTLGSNSRQSSSPSAPVLISSRPQNSTFFQSPAVKSVTYNVLHLSHFSLPLLTGKLLTSAPFMNSHVFVVMTFSQSTRLLTYRLKIFLLKDVLNSASTSCDTIHRYAYFSTCSRVSPSSITELGTPSEISSSSSSVRFRVYAALLEEQFSWHTPSVRLLPALTVGCHKHCVLFSSPYIRIWAVCILAPTLQLMSNDIQRGLGCECT